MVPPGQNKTKFMHSSGAILEHLKWTVTIFVTDFLQELKILKFCTFWAGGEKLIVILELKINTN